MGLKDKNVSGHAKVSGGEVQRRLHLLSAVGGSW
jgi:hypothetical protein